MAIIYLIPNFSSQIILSVCFFPQEQLGLAASASMRVGHKKTNKQVEQVMEKTFEVCSLDLILYPNSRGPKAYKLLCFIKKACSMHFFIRTIKF